MPMNRARLDSQLVGATLLEDALDPRDVDDSGRVGLFASEGDTLTLPLIVAMLDSGIETVLVTTNRDQHERAALDVARRAQVLSDTAKTIDEHKQAAYEHNAAYFAFRDLAETESNAPLKRFFQACMRTHNRKSHEHAMHVAHASR